MRPLKTLVLLAALSIPWIPFVAAEVACPTTGPRLAPAEPRSAVLRQEFSAYQVQKRLVKPRGTIKTIWI